jgi:hypothetical protein
MSVGFTTAAKGYDVGSIGALGAVANGAGIDLSATFKPHAAGDKLGAADAAHDQAAAKLEQARDARFALSGALEQKQDGGKWSGHGVAANRPSLKAQLLDGAANTAIFAVDPSVGAACMVATVIAETVRFAQNALSMGGDGAVGAHAGIQHAAINPGKSTFGSLTKERGRDPILLEYIDSMGSNWGEGGLAVTNQPVQSPRPGHAINPKMQAAAGIVVDQLGEEQIRKELSGASIAEKRLAQQAAAAEKEWNFKSTRKIEAPSLG